MKTKIQKLIEDQKRKYNYLLSRRDTAEALKFHTECSSISEQMKAIDVFISELEGLLND